MIKRCPSLKKHSPHYWKALVVSDRDILYIEPTDEYPITEVSRDEVRYDCPGLDDALARYIELYGENQDDTY